jgi:prepilin-type N-terminal cleavage/methylation domain-containing protein
MRSSRAFTLIELLVVIAIIGILASLLFPAVNGAIDSARKAQAKNDVVQIATAVTAYETEYGRLPLPTKTSVDTELVNVLIGVSTNDNPRRIVFMEVTAAKRGKSGTNSSGFVDPWSTNQPYRIAMDEDYDNEIDAGTNSQPLRKRVGVWNDPSTQSNVSAGQRARRYVTSWE